MAYSDFTLQNIHAILPLTWQENFGFFDNNTPIKLSQNLQENLADNIQLATAINTEKAKSELLIAPMLLALRRNFKSHLSLFSGTEFNVDKTLGLNGFCDFLLSLSPEQLWIKSPIVMIVEAKNDNVMSGMAQCIAEMVAAQKFNKQHQNNIAHIYGVITTGLVWQFLQLDQNNNIIIDLKPYFLPDQSEKIFGILSAMVQS